MVQYTQMIVVDSDFMYTLLIKRNNSPEKGKLSGIGGRIEENESPEDCMHREWEEEVGSPFPDDAMIYKLMKLKLSECDNHIFGVILPNVDIYFTHNEQTDNEGFIRWHHIIGEKIMDINNKIVAWNGLIPYCLTILKENTTNCNKSVQDSEFNEQDHKRDKNGKFAETSGVKEPNKIKNKMGDKKSIEAKSKKLQNLKEKMAKHIKDYGYAAELMSLNLELDDKIKLKKTTEMSRKVMIDRKNFNNQEIEQQQELRIKINQLDSEIKKEKEELKYNDMSEREKEAYKGRKLMASSFDEHRGKSIKLKKKVCNDIAKKLSKDANFLKYAEGEPLSNVTKSLVSSWATTSADNNIRALSLQKTSEETFGFKSKHNLMEDKSSDTNKLISEDMKKNGAAYKSFLKAQYDNTQKYFKEKGITEIEVYRGMQNIENDIGKKKTTLRLQPMSSFSTSFDTANMFANAGDGFGTISKAVIPVEDILSTPFTGFGCLHENELVVIGRGDITATLITTIAGKLKEITEESF
ncbi:MAG: NUDIX hydrolase [Parabacteroides sp.]